MYFLLILLFPLTLFTQETNDTEDVIPISSSISQDQKTAQNYRPGLNFQSTSISTDNSAQNLIDSAAVNLEYTEVGRIGALRLDGAGTQPLMGIDGFLIKDPSINSGQILLDLLPYDFAERVDIYKQNLVPYGVNAGSFVDFRIPITYSSYTDLFTRISTTANLYAKIQGEQIFQDGSTFFGLAGDFGLHDYYYGTDGGKDFAFYPNSTFNRTSFLSKTVWKNLEFLIANTYSDGYSEEGIGVGGGAPTYSLDKLIRNNLITGIRYSQDIFFVNANYTFYNQYVEGKSYTNDYLNHQLNIQTGARQRIDRYSYQVSLGYEFNNVEDGNRANNDNNHLNGDNYLGVPKEGEHLFHIVGEFGVSLFKEEDQRDFNVDFNLALNQIVSSRGLYTPVPSFTLGLRHRNGFYSSAHVSRIYVLPDITTAYGFGAPSPQTNRILLPKDGIRSGFEIGVNRSLGRFYASFSYAWLDWGFRLADDNLTMINSANVTALSAEIGGELKYLAQGNIYKAHTGFAWNYEIDDRGLPSSTIPLWKWILKFSVQSMDDTWMTALSYRLTACTPGGGEYDTIPRHYLDLNFRYKMLTINILNLANQSYRSQPGNLYSPYNPGIRAEVGISYRFNHS